MGTLQFEKGSTKEQVFETVELYLKDNGFIIAETDQDRPWGGYFVIDERQAADFIKKFFGHLTPADFTGFEKLSPKFLLVAPKQRLSWQYHHRRSEIWKVISGTVAVAASNTDEQGEPRLLSAGLVIELEKGQRHRLIGVDEWGIVAEIWKHTDPKFPSDEDDIVRVEDDFGR